MDDTLDATNAGVVQTTSTSISTESSTNSQQVFPRRFDDRAGSLFAGMWLILIPIIVVGALVQGYALWKSARNNQSGWFVAMLIFQSVGILPVLYLIFFKKNKNIIVELPKANGTTEQVKIT